MTCGTPGCTTRPTLVRRTVRLPSSEPVLLYFCEPHGRMFEQVAHVTLERVRGKAS